METGAAFLAQSREYLSEHYLPKLLEAVSRVDDATLWWRPNEASNSIGNLLLHLSGNLRQWLVSGVGGAPDHRERQAEFAERKPLPRRELLERFTATIREADAALARLPASDLGAHRSIQGREITCLEAIYHAVEHCSMHLGQILYIVKLRSGADLGFYQLKDGVVRPAWPGHPESGSA